MDAYEIVAKIRQQNWKNGGALVVDTDEAVALVDNALMAERERCARIAATFADSRYVGDEAEWSSTVARAIARAIRQ